MANETDTLQAVGHGVLTLINATILVAILAVILAPGGAAADTIRQFFGLLSWLVGIVVQPLKAGQAVQLTATAAPASQVALAGTGGGGGNPVTGPAQTQTSPQSARPGAATFNICDDATGQVTGLGQVGFESLIPQGSHMC